MPDLRKKLDELADGLAENYGWSDRELGKKRAKQELVASLCEWLDAGCFSASSITSSTRQNSSMIKSSVVTAHSFHFGLVT